MRATSESAEWIFLATNLGLEMLSAACDQASSPRRPHYALFGMLLAIAAVLISILELIYRGKKERVVLRRWGMLWWFYHPPPRHTPFGTLPDIFGLAAGITQCICSIVQYVYCLRHADNPFKASLLPAVFLVCLGGSKLCNNRMNANTSSTEETLLPAIQKYYASANILFLDDQEVEVEGNIEGQRQQEQEQERLLQELQQEQEQDQERLMLQRLLQELRQEQEQEQEWLLLQRLLQELQQRQEQEQEQERLLLQQSPFFQVLVQWQQQQQRQQLQRLLQAPQELQRQQRQQQKFLRQQRQWQEQKFLRQRRVVKSD